MTGLSKELLPRAVLLWVEQWSVRDLAVTISRLPVYNTGMTRQAMQEPTFLILMALAAGPQHGYGINDRGRRQF